MQNAQVLAGFGCNYPTLHQYCSVHPPVSTEHSSLHPSFVRLQNGRFLPEATVRSACAEVSWESITAKRGVQARKSVLRWSTTPER